jgi:hypothetical protein
VLLLSLQGAVAQCRGFNLIQTPEVRFDDDRASVAFARMRAVGANCVALIPFLWQATPSDPDVRRGADMTDDQLRHAVRRGKAHGLQVVVKPHVWVPQSWAGAIVMNSPEVWREWFARYESAISTLADIAQQEGAEVFVIGTELRGASLQPEWTALIAAVRERFKGVVTYAAHGADDAERFAFWGDLDAVAATAYPELGPRAPDAWAARIAAELDRLDAVAQRVRKPLWLTEFGVRSAVGAAEKPWESPEERQAAPDDVVQARYIATWLDALDRPNIAGVLIWRWFSDPDRGGRADTDFTVQGKLAEGVLFCRWGGACKKR